MKYVSQSDLEKITIRLTEILNNLTNNNNIIGNEFQIMYSDISIKNKTLTIQLFFQWAFYSKITNLSKTIKNIDGRLINLDLYIENIINPLNNSEWKKVFFWLINLENYIENYKIFTAINKQDLISNVIYEITALKFNTNKLAKEKEKLNSELKSMQFEKKKIEKVLSFYTNSQEQITKKQDFITKSEKDSKDLIIAINKSSKNIEDYKKNYQSHLKDLVEIRTDYNALHLKNIEDNKILKEGLVSFKIATDELNLANKKAVDTQNLLDKLLDPSLAQNLRLTFEKRKTNLEKSKNIWLGGIVLSSLLLIVMLVGMPFILKNLYNENFINLSPGLILLHSLKIVPFAILLYFSIRQYNRERILQEEYAFRETIAVSLVPFSKEMKEDGNKRDELIKTTIMQLYKSPLLHERSYSRANKNSLNEISQRLVDEVTKRFKKD